ncbi:MAG TPA: hypothetical protein VFE46_02455 [Pirellulales bacterium]|jgi:hypothetical protein|nr:hypothetical protein [Pirellulales bacterium]
MIKDLIVEEVHRVSEMLIKKHGGLRGYIKHLQALDKAKKHRPTRRRPTRRKRSA